MALNEPAHWIGWCFYTLVLLLLGCAFVVSLVLIVGFMLSATYKLVYMLLSGATQQNAEKANARWRPRFSLLGLVALTTTVAFWTAVGGQLRWQFVDAVLMFVGAMTPFALPLVILLVANWLFSASDRRREMVEQPESLEDDAQRLPRVKD